MTKQDYIHSFVEIFHCCSGNSVNINEEDNPELVLFEKPLVGFASASDPLFDQYKQPEAIGPSYMKPGEWLSDSQTVISFFLPFTKEVRISNTLRPKLPSTEWLYGRIEGQAFVAEFLKQVSLWLNEQGYHTCIPVLDERFEEIRKEVPADIGTDFHVESRWSERHAAYVCGLGTFGLSRGLITQKGMAGRFGSILVNTSIEPDKRPYTGVYDYCIRCGACITRCPANAISLEYGKNNHLCYQWTMDILEQCKPRFGCGKCQTDVPCEDRIP